MEKQPWEWNWNELSRYFRSNQSLTFLEKKEWFSVKPFNLNLEDILRKTELILSPERSSLLGNYYRGEILINSILTGFKRDVTVFHELIHAYGHLVHNDPLCDNYSLMSDIDERKEIEENAVLVEYHARKMRAQPEILKMVIGYFGLIPNIYDQISFLSFQEYLDQLTIHNYQDIQMD